MTTLSLIVPAAGCGQRAGTNGNKILVALGKKPLLHHTLRALTAPEAYPHNVRITQLIIAAREEEFELIQPILDNLTHSPTHPPTLSLIEGGPTRQASVFNAVRAATGEFVLVHDAARPLVSAALIFRVVDTALESDAALAALPCPDTVKRATPDGAVAGTLNRNTIWLAQTPQVFRREILLAALENAQRENYNGTDCSSLVERLPGQRVMLVPGDSHNFKVTYPEDVARAGVLLGSGADAD